MVFKYLRTKFDI